MEYRFVDEYTDTPGGRFTRNGPYSGEDFRETQLKPRISQLKAGEKLKIIFDGAYGYAISFLEEAFGGLARELGKEKVLSLLDFESNDEPDLVDRVLSYIKDVE